MSKNSDVTRCDVPEHRQRGRARIAVSQRPSPPSEPRTGAEPVPSRRAAGRRPSSRPGVDRRGLVRARSAAGEVADDQRQPGDQPPAKPPPGCVVPGEQQVERDHDHHLGRAAG